MKINITKTYEFSQEDLEKVATASLHSVVGVPVNPDALAFEWAEEDDGERVKLTIRDRTPNGWKPPSNIR